ncbi:MAG: hypothetical protein NUV82_02960 [Candidatus Komeilibacteria bacterium]|nr:hypothetical protein [Candidatus Komeilibacteria bacterium]
MRSHFSWPVLLIIIILLILTAWWLGRSSGFQQAREFLGQPVVYERQATDAHILLHLNGQSYQSNVTGVNQRAWEEIIKIAVANNIDLDYNQDWPEKGLTRWSFGGVDAADVEIYHNFVPTTDIGNLRLQRGDHLIILVNSNER